MALRQLLRPSRPLFLVGVAIGVPAAARAAVVTVDFNTPSDVSRFIQNNNRNNTNPNTNQFLSYSSTGGIKDLSGGTANGGAVTANGTDSTADYQGNGVDLTATATTLSMLSKPGTAGGGVRVPQIGFLNSNVRSFNAELTDTAFISVRFNTNGNAAAGAVEVQTKPLNGGTATASNTATLAVNATDWYRLSLTLTPTNIATGAYNYSFALDDLGPDGTGTPTNALAVAGPITGSTTVAAFAASANGGTGQAAVAGFRSTSNTATFDNFTLNGTLVATPAVPEPAAAGLLGLGAGGLLLRRRQRRA